MLCYSLFRCNRNINSKDYTGDSKATAVTDRVWIFKKSLLFYYSAISRSVASLKRNKDKKGDLELHSTKPLTGRERQEEWRTPGMFSGTGSWLESGEGEALVY